MSALILTYHAVGPGPRPLHVDVATFARHVACIVESGVTTFTVGALAAALRSGRLPERAVAITFDDGYASVISNALPVLERHRVAATVFCVARRLGLPANWPSPVPAMPLASADDLRRLAGSGWEIGSHGLDHAPLVAARVAAEAHDSRALLEEATGAAVRSFAYPYGVVPGGSAAVLAAAGYTAACTTRAARVSFAGDALRLPRVDAHYLRSTRLLDAALAGRLDRYFAVRRLAARARRAALPDHGR